MFGFCKGAPKTSDSITVVKSEQVTTVPRENLFVSEPDPHMFGNGPNPSKGKRAGWSNENWLKSRFHFNFAEHRTGPSNFGVLRVMNDDLVQPERGFGMHPHRDMEILTYITDGFLTHKDSMGTEETIGRGSLQFMTAGTGIRHSEHNLRPDSPLRFIQMWITPRQRGLQPKYGSMLGGDAATKDRKDKWAQIVSDVSGKVSAPVQINQDCNMFVTELSPDSTSPPFEIREGRQAYMLCLEGELALGCGMDCEPSLRRHDAAELKGPLTLELTARGEGCFVLLLEMARS